GDGGLEQVRHRLRRGVRAVRRPERVVYVEVAERGEDAGERRIVVLFPGPEPGVLDERDTSAGQAPCRRDAGGRVGNELDRGAQQAFEVSGHLPQRVLRVGATLGTPQV